MWMTDWFEDDDTGWRVEDASSGRELARLGANASDADRAAVAEDLRGRGWRTARQLGPWEALGEDLTGGWVRKAADTGEAVAWVPPGIAADTDEGRAAFHLEEVRLRELGFDGSWHCEGPPRR